MPDQSPYTSLIPPISTDEFQVLKASSKEQGLLQPLDYDADDVLLDGYHRLRACEELGIEIPDDMKRVRDELTTGEAKGRAAGGSSHRATQQR